MGKKSAPAPPDPKETAAAQTGQNLGTAVANTVMGQVNQVGPDGSLTYDQTGTYNWQDPSSGRNYALPQYTATTTLSEDAQQLRDANNRGNLTMANLGADQAERVGDILGQPFDPNSITPQRADRSGFGPAEYSGDLTAPTMQDGYENDFGVQKKEVEEALMGRLNEQRGYDHDQLRTQLSNQGIGIGTEAYSRAMEDFDRSVDDRRTTALLAAGQEQSRLVDMARDEASFGNTARQQDFNNQQSIQGRDDQLATSKFNQQRAVFDDQDRARAGALDEAYTARNQPINEITALLSGSQVQTPSFAMAQPYAMPTTDIAGITQQGYNNEFGAWQQNQQNRNAMIGGMFGLGSAYLGRPTG